MLSSQLQSPSEPRISYLWPYHPDCAQSPLIIEPGISWHWHAQNLAMPNPADTCQPVHMTVTQEGQAHLHGRPKEPSGPLAPAMRPLWLERPAPGLSGVRDEAYRTAPATYPSGRSRCPRPRCPGHLQANNRLIQQPQYLVRTYWVSGTVLGTQWGRSWKRSCYFLLRPQEG